MFAEAFKCGEFLHEHLHDNRRLQGRDIGIRYCHVIGNNAQRSPQIIGIETETKLSVPKPDAGFLTATEKSLECSKNLFRILFAACPLHGLMTNNILPFAFRMEVAPCEERRKQFGKLCDGTIINV